ncbi:MAG: response regulator [Planctomycetota bacterium]
MSEQGSTPQSPNETPALVYVVDDDQAVRDSVCFLLESASIPSQSFANAEDFLAGFDQGLHSCLVLDVRMDGMSGLELQKKLREMNLRLPIIVVTGHSDVPMAVTAMRDGAFDLLEKPYTDEVLLERIREALHEDADIRRVEGGLDEVKAKLQDLSPREREVMEFVVAGYLNKQIASKLGLSVKTIEVHRSRVMQKMKARSLAALVRMAMTAGIEVGLV